LKLSRAKILGNAATIVVLVGSLAFLRFGRPVVDAYASRAWVRHVAVRDVSVAEARQAVRRAVAALQRTASLPVSADVARISLEIVRSDLAEHPQSALELAAQMRQQLESLQGSWRRLGSGKNLAAAQALEDEARTAAAAAAASPRRRRR
jgi:hypothetical protein